MGSGRHWTGRGAVGSAYAQQHRRRTALSIVWISRPRVLFESSPAHDRVVVPSCRVVPTRVKPIARQIAIRSQKIEGADDTCSKQLLVHKTARLSVSRRHRCLSPNVGRLSSRTAITPPRTDHVVGMTPRPPRAEPQADSAASRKVTSTTASDHCTTDDHHRRAMSPAITAADNVAYFRPAADGDKPTPAAANGGRQTNGAPDRHQLPPSALTPVQFEMSYGTPAATAADHNAMSSKDNLLTPRGQYELF